MKLKNFLIFFILIIIFIFIGSFIFKDYFIINKNNEKIQVSILNQKIYKENQEILLNDITPFNWDKVYSFKPYTSKEEIEKILGFKSIYISEGISEGMMQLIFVKDKRIVANICAHPNKVLYSINFSKENDLYSKIEKSDNVTLLANKKDEIVYLTKSN